MSCPAAWAHVCRNRSEAACSSGIRCQREEWVALEFDAHLIGFRGIGSRVGDPFADKAKVLALGKGICPGVILRLADGRKRCFARGGCYLTGKLQGRDPDPPRDRANARSAARGAFDPEFPLPIFGFRIVLAPEIETLKGE